MLIYVAGPLTHGEGLDFIAAHENLDILQQTAVELLRRGHVPVVGGHNLLLARLAAEQGTRWHEDFWRHRACELVRVCDAVLVIGDSVGTAVERIAAYDWGVEVFSSIEDIPQAATRDYKLAHELLAHTTPEDTGKTPIAKQPDAKASKKGKKR